MTALLIQAGCHCSWLLILRSRAKRGVSKDGGIRAWGHPSRLAALAPQDEVGVQTAVSGDNNPFASRSSGITILSLSIRPSKVSAPVASPGTSSLDATQTLASSSHSALTWYGAMRMLLG